MDKLFYDIINEAKDGTIIIDGDDFPIGFNTIINNKVLSFINPNFPTLIINDYNKFLDRLNYFVQLSLNKRNKFPKFVFENSKIKLLIAYLFVNVTSEDFSNPINLIERNIGFLEDTTLDSNININLDNAFNQSTIKIKSIKESIFMETPNKLEISLNKQNSSFKLPSISYGILQNQNGEKECYIYSILNSNKQDNDEISKQYSKKISRQLFKLNSGIDNNESDEFIDFKNKKSNFYPENISDVSVNAVLSLSIFISLLKINKINKIKVVSYLPLRFLSREINSNVYKEENEEKYNKLNNRNEFIQSNATEKFLRTFNRVAFHMNCIDIKSMPYEYSEFMEIHLTNDNKINNEIIKEINNKLFNYNIQKKL
ncbi:MAG: hypothetical protein ACK5HL_01450 [Bacilli bacterium]